ncbi:DBF4-type zinc finger-containing protein 2 [Solea solea]|uniref:DBF4-type zinc finger-containing protein 2 n=1 Tax=Solea solea TaxID=90069 RepID=UPI00272DAF46|nr:DBF4-type zinc finger-containing protein 2 [Solea solea]
MEPSDWTETYFNTDEQQGAAECSSRKWEGSPPRGRGYCGYCRIVYGNLEQHLSSLRHLHAVSSSRSPAPSSSVGGGRLMLLERFLQDVVKHHPHSYSDCSPAHADLPSVSAPLPLKAELDEVCFSDDDTKVCRPSSGHASCQPANQQQGRVTERLTGPIREQDDTGTAHIALTHSQVLTTQATATHTLFPPTIHRKAHRKTNRRKTSDSSPSPPSRESRHRLSDLNQRAETKVKPRPQSRPSDLKPWLSWQRERRGAFFSEQEEVCPRRSATKKACPHHSAIDQTIQEVIQLFCHGVTSSSCPQEETESFHVSLPVSMETESDTEWDSPVQVALTLPSHTPDQGRQAEGGAWGRGLNSLLDVQVHLEDQVYLQQLDSALLGQQRGRGGADKGFWTRPIEEVLPVPAHIPQSFRGKSWTQIEQEDEDKVKKLVDEFRRGLFVCYFDSDDNTRYGRRSQKKKGRGENSSALLPLLDCNESVYSRKRRSRGRGFRVASRCQVVKVSHSTQTVQLVIPAVRQPEAPPTSVPAANHETTERTPEARTWLRLPPSYSSVVTPVQPHTSLVYLLCSPSCSAPKPSLGPASKGCRKKRHPVDLQKIKVKYKRLPVRFYEPSTHRILSTAPKCFRLHQGAASSAPPPPCVRQLFRSLSADLNMDSTPGEVKGHMSADTSTLRDAMRRRGRESKTTPPLPHNRPEQCRGVRKERTHPPPSNRRTRTQATPSLPRRGRLRRPGPAPVQPPPRRGRSRRRRR